MYCDLTEELPWHLFNLAMQFFVVVLVFLLCVMHRLNCNNPFQMLQERVTEHFHALKPLCDRVMKHPSTNHLRELEMAVNKIGVEELQILQAYIIFPLEVHLRTNRSQ